MDSNAAAATSPIDEHAAYHRKRAAQERERADMAQDPAARRAHEQLAFYHDEAVDGRRTMRLVI